MGIAAAATARRNKLKRNAEWRTNRRIMSDAFKQTEQQSRDKYSDFVKLSREFSKAYPDEFKMFLLAKSKNMQAPRQSFGIPRHIPATVTPHVTSPTTPPIQLHDFRSVSSERRIPSASAMEASRMPPRGPSEAATGTLAALGIRLD
jgi:hypothetical protein